MTTTREVLYYILTHGRWMRIKRRKEIRGKALPQRKLAKVFKDANIAMIVQRCAAMDRLIPFKLDGRKWVLLPEKYHDWLMRVMEYG